MLEWLKRHAWKACMLQKGIGGSNPPLSANKYSVKGFKKSFKRISKCCNFKELRYFYFINVSLIYTPPLNLF